LLFERNYPQKMVGNVLQHDTLPWETTSITIVTDKQKERFLIHTESV